MSDEVEDAVVAGPVVPGDPGPVEREDHGQAVQPHVEIGLVEGAAEERGVDRHHRPQPGHGHAGRGGDGVLLRDAHVEEAVGELGLEGEEPGGSGHRRGDGHDLGPLPGRVEHGAGEGVGVRGRRDRGRRGHRGGLHLEVVQALDVVLFGRGVAPALLGDARGPRWARPTRWRGASACSMPAMSWPSIGPGVADPEGLEEPVRRHDLAHGAGEAVQARVGEATETGDRPQHVAGPLAGVDVGRAQAQGGEAGRQPRHRRRVRPSVVVEHDHDAGAGMAEVVERLVGHAPGERPVAQHRHHAPIVLAPTLQAHGDPVRVAEGGRGVAVLDPVVRGLRPRRIPRHPARLAEGGEALLAAR